MLTLRKCLKIAIAWRTGPKLEQGRGEGSLASRRQAAFCLGLVLEPLMASIRRKAES